MKYLLLMIITIALYGCANVPGVRNEAPTISDQPQCRSVVEAFLRTDTVYHPKPPYIVLKKSQDFNGTRTYRGGIIELNDSGVVFLRSKDGQYSVETKFYPFSDIECLIDSNNQIVIGEWKKKIGFWNIELMCQKEGNPDAELFSIVLQPNQKVSYCIEPGEYRIVYLRFRSTDNYLDCSDSLCCSRFTVARNAITYIGTFELEYRWKPSSGMTMIPFKVLHHQGMNSTYPPMGLVGGALQYYADKEKAEKEAKETPFHALKIINDSSYVPLFKEHLPLNFCPVGIQK